MQISPENETTFHCGDICRSVVSTKSLLSWAKFHEFDLLDKGYLPWGIHTVCLQADALPRMDIGP